jgi:hypothetical protein
MPEGPQSFSVELWVDQVFHITALAVIVLLIFR